MKEQEVVADIMFVLAKIDEEGFTSVCGITKDKHIADVWDAAGGVSFGLDPTGFPSSSGYCQR